MFHLMLSDSRIIIAIIGVSINVLSTFLTSSYLPVTSYCCLLPYLSIYIAIDFASWFVWYPLILLTKSFCCPYMSYSHLLVIVRYLSHHSKVLLNGHHVIWGFLISLLLAVICVWLPYVTLFSYWLSYLNQYHVSLQGTYSVSLQIKDSQLNFWKMFCMISLFYAFGLHGLNHWLENDPLVGMLYVCVLSCCFLSWYFLLLFSSSPVCCKV